MSLNIFSGLTTEIENIKFTIHSIGIRHLKIFSQTLVEAIGIALEDSSQDENLEKENIALEDSGPQDETSEIVLEDSGPQDETSEKVKISWGAIQRAIPAALPNLVDILSTCIVCEDKEVLKQIQEVCERDGLDSWIEALPHHFLPQLLDVWIEESFGTEGKRKPWVTTVQKILKRVQKKNLPISDTSLQS